MCDVDGCSTTTNLVPIGENSDLCEHHLYLAVKAVASRPKPKPKKRNLGAMKDRGGYQQEIKALLDVLTFGKYKGQTIEQVIEIDAAYIVYLNDERIAKVSDEIVGIAEEAENDQRRDEGERGFGEWPSMWDYMEEPF